MTINISDNNPRISYTATSGQTAFTVPFVFFNDADLNVYINDTLKTITTDYTVTGGDGSTGSITLTSGATLNDVVVITRNVALERTTDFPSSGPFQVASLNTELDTIIAMVADMEDLAERGLRLSDSDTSASLVLADKDARKGTVLAFNATTGAVEVGPTIADTETIASIKADIATLADIEDGTDATDAIQTVAGISSNVTTVAGISSDVTTVAGNNANVTTVAGNDANITTVAGISANVTTVAGISSDVTSVAGDATDIGTVATNIANVNTVAANDANITTVAGQTTNMQNITDNLTAVQNAATNATNAATSASNASTSESNAAASAASAAASFDAFDDRYLGAKSDDPATDNDGDALDAGDQYFNTTDNELKVYNGSAWQSASVVGGTVTSLTTSSLDANGGTIDGTVIGGTTPAAGTFTTLTADDINMSDSDTPKITMTDTTNTLTTFIQSGNSSSVIGTSTDHDLRIQRNSTDIIDVLSTGIDVTGTITSDGLTVDGSATEVKFTTTAGRMDLFLTDTDTTDGQVRIRGDANTLSFITNTTNAMTIDASQNVLVSKTSSDTNTAGVEARNNGQLVATLDGGTALIANRKTSDGDVVKIMKDGSTVGVIGTQNWGIGTSSPDRLLHLASSAAIVCIEDTAGATDDKRAQIQVDNGQFEINSRNDDNSSRTDNIFVADLGTGNIGIGTNSITSASDNARNLVIDDASGNAGITIRTQATSGYSSVYFGDSASYTSGRIEYRHGDDAMVFSTVANQRMRIDSDGNVLIGTDSGDAFNSDSSLRLQNGGNNYVQIKTPTTNQAGYMVGDTADDFAGGMIYNNSGDYLRFDSDNAERLRITGANFMFNQTDSNPLATLIEATGGDAIGIDSDNGYVAIKRNESGAGLYINKTDSANGQLIQFRSNGVSKGDISTNGTTVSYNTTSDYRLKENVTDITDGIERVKQLNPSRFNFIADADRTVDGFLAHEVSDIVPEAVTGEKDGMRDEEYEVTPAIYEDVVIPAVLDDDGNEIEAERTEQQLVSKAVIETRSVPIIKALTKPNLCRC